MSDKDYTTPEEPNADDINRAEDQIDDLGPELREDPDWREAIGPEDADPAVLDEQLEQYGFDRMERDEDLSLPGAEPLPNWAQNTAEPDEIRQARQGQTRPVEDEADEAVDED